MFLLCVCCKTTTITMNVTVVHDGQFMTLAEFRAMPRHPVRRVFVDNHVNRPVSIDDDFDGYAVELLGAAVVTTPGLIQLVLDHETMHLAEITADVQFIVIICTLETAFDYARIDALIERSVVDIVIMDGVRRVTFQFMRGETIDVQWFEAEVHRFATVDQNN